MKLLTGAGLLPVILGLWLGFVALWPQGDHPTVPGHWCTSGISLTNGGVMPQGIGFYNQCFNDDGP